MQMINRKGILLAGGLATRMFPSTYSISKQILPVYDKPMIFYSLSVLMLSNIKDILIISSQRDIIFYKNLFNNGKNLGLNIEYAVQKKPNGIAEAFIIGKKFINNQPCALILGDNFFYGESFQEKLIKVSAERTLSTVFSYHVSNPKDYGVIELDNKNKKVIKIIEKPSKPTNNKIVTGLYFYDKNVSKYAALLKPSKRGELEITDLNNIYIKKNMLNVENLGRGFTWFDLGSSDNMLEASNFVYSMEKKQGLKIACLEEISYFKKYINKDDLKKISNRYSKSPYGEYLKALIK